MEEKLIYIDGEFYKKSEAKISVFDHGFLYGDGVFEGIRVYNGKIFKCKEHVDRLYQAAKAIYMEIPISKEEMIEALKKTCRINNIREGYIRLVVSRGVGDLGLSPTKCPKPTIVIIADSIVLYPQEMYEKGMKVITASTRRNSPQCVDPQIKSLNYLNNILAKIEANRAGVPEAIMLTQDGYVTECTGDNIFIVKDGELITPPVYLGALDGITRRTVMALAKDLGIPVYEKIFTLYNLYNADECFFTGTAAEVIAVTEVDGRKIGNGEVGPITKKLMEEFKKLTQIDGVDIYE
ncbi:branched-chain amino acid aminotransferase [Caldicellulosiruptor obsidiansis OB47]|uniref:Branched-chain-amino-acid aminotransferase n=1 Tax=Caldicellulosiruptor obsidiansis (strain ATCC BAA-2073 / JCM 16842 / OB47) TaxID=608506 RepID=D9TIV6_CALOO|nr:branched-chain-amino-acid transaminase [Caldicellulosiruptor obsidiansis]ADL41938.1 branched-chain amino acid aminotransferase [Caldicellulosiruptor obsidiansis OB47]